MSRFGNIARFPLLCTIIFLTISRLLTVFHYIASVVEGEGFLTSKPLGHYEITSQIGQLPVPNLP